MKSRSKKTIFDKFKFHEENHEDNEKFEGFNNFDGLVKERTQTDFLMKYIFFLLNSYLLYVALESFICKINLSFSIISNIEVY